MRALWLSPVNKGTVAGWHSPDGRPPVWRNARASCPCHASSRRDCTTLTCTLPQPPLFHTDPRVHQVPVPRPRLLHAGAPCGGRGGAEGPGRPAAGGAEAGVRAGGRGREKVLGKGEGGTEYQQCEGEGACNEGPERPAAGGAAPGLRAHKGGSARGWGRGGVRMRLRACIGGPGRRSQEAAAPPRLVQVMKQRGRTGLHAPLFVSCRVAVGAKPTCVTLRSRLLPSLRSPPRPVFHPAGRVPPDTDHPRPRAAQAAGRPDADGAAAGGAGGRIRAGHQPRGGAHHRISMAREYRGRGFVVWSAWCDEEGRNGWDGVRCGATLSPRCNSMALEDKRWGDCRVAARPRCGRIVAWPGRNQVWAPAHVPWGIFQILAVLVQSPSPR